MRWQKHARAGVAIFGVVFGMIVYFAIGERQSAAPASRPERFDPAAILESAGAVLQQFREAKQDYVIQAERQLTYEGGATKLIGVTIEVRGKAGRDFTVAAQEAHAGPNQKELEITGGVRMTASDGFVMTTDRASFSEIDTMVRAPGAVAFEKGRMRGSGVGMSYDQANDVLSLAGEAHVEVVDEQGNPVTDFTAASATLARQEDYLALEGNVHALRGDQVLEADRSIARLTAGEEYITAIELRGNARVVGGGVFDSVTARDIDLDYTEDGQTLERVGLTGGGAIVLRGGGEGEGRELTGDSLDLAFAPDASLTSAIGRDNVRFALPPSTDGPARTIEAQAFDAAGAAGEGLTAASFSGNVRYREEGQRGNAARAARSNALRITLDGDAVTRAVFTGSVRFEEQGLHATAAQAEYDPANGILRLSGGAPQVTDDDISLEAGSIDLTLRGRRMSARGGVRTTLRPPRQAGGAASRDRKLPGLLAQEQAANVNADMLEYRGGAGTAVYSGAATLWQGETAIRADTITLDQTSGDVIAGGNARLNLALDAGLSVGRAAEIRYDDTGRRLIFSSVTTAAPATTAVAPPAGAARGPGAAGAAPVTAATAAPPNSQLSGPPGDLRAVRIDLVLGQGGGRTERLEAYRGVSLRVDARVATADRLVYFAEDERYELTGVPTVPVTIVEACRETTGRTVTFFKSTERIIVDGNEEARTQSKRGSACAPTAAP